MVNMLRAALFVAAGVPFGIAAHRADRLATAISRHRTTAIAATTQAAAIAATVALTWIAAVNPTWIHATDWAATMAGIAATIGWHRIGWRARRPLSTPAPAGPPADSHRRHSESYG